MLEMAYAAVQVPLLLSAALHLRILADGRMVRDQIDSLRKSRARPC